MFWREVKNGCIVSVSSSCVWIKIRIVLSASSVLSYEMFCYEKLQVLSRVLDRNSVELLLEIVLNLKLRLMLLML